MAANILYGLGDPMPRWTTEKVSDGMRTSGSSADISQVSEGIEHPIDEPPVRVQQPTTTIKLADSAEPQNVALQPDWERPRT